LSNPGARGPGPGVGPRRRFRYDVGRLRPEDPIPAPGARRPGVDLVLALGLVTLAALAFSHALGPDTGLFWGDHGLVFRQRWWFAQDALRAGSWPARTWASASGLPLEQLLNATYTPLTLLLFLGDFEVTYDVFVAAHVAVLAVGAFGLARSLGATPMEAGAAAAVAFLGPIISFENLLVGLAGLAYLPWVLWALRRLLQAPSPANVAALGLAGGFHLQGIMPETALLDVLAGGLLVAVTRPQLHLRTAAALGAGLLLAGGIASVELMPVLETLAGTPRGAGFSLAEQQRWSVHPLQLLGTAVPSGFGLPELPTLRRPFEVSDRLYLVSIYLAWLPELALVALARRRTRGWAAALLALALLFTVVALGPATPLHGMLAQLPVLRSGRFPVKYLILTAAALAALVVPGLRAAREHPKALALLLALRVALLAGLLQALSMEEVQAYLQTWIAPVTLGRFPTVPRRRPARRPGRRPPGPPPPRPRLRRAGPPHHLGDAEPGRPPPSPPPSPSCWAWTWPSGPASASPGPR
jgi:hypothetical protein